MDHRNAEIVKDPAYEQAAVAALRIFLAAHKGGARRGRHSQ